MRLYASFMLAGIVLH